VKHTLVQGSLAFALVLGAAGAGPAADLGLITGSEKGTYYQFGVDLQNLGKQTGINLTVYPSRGSVENVYAVYQRPGVQMGFVQSDVLAFVAKVQTDPTLAKIAEKTKLIFPLYNEEVHLLGRREIADFDDLAGRRVAVGREGSGTYLTVRLLFRLSGVVPAEMAPIDTEEALAALKAGRIDAMFDVAGYPVKLLTEDVTAADRLALIPILNKSIVEFYPPAEIPANTYAWQGSPVSTVTVKAVLISYDFRTRDCDAVGRFGQTLSTMMEWLKKNGHPKWNAVDLGYPLKGWEQYDCVKRYLGKPVTPARGNETATRQPDQKRLEAGARGIQDEYIRGIEAALIQGAEEEGRRKTETQKARRRAEAPRPQAEASARPQAEAPRPQAETPPRPQAEASPQPQAGTPQTQVARSAPAPANALVPTLSAQEVSRLRAELERKLRSRGLFRESTADRWGLALEIDGLANVTLSGQLRDAALWSETVRLVRETPGVKEVKAENVRVAQMGPVSVGQAESGRIRTQVQQRLRSRGLLRESNSDRWGVTVDVTAEGEVTLVGVLKDANLRGDAVRLAQEVPGVRRVKQNVQVIEGTAGR
jgi:uncharacterized protein